MAREREEYAGDERSKDRSNDRRARDAGLGRRRRQRRCGGGTGCREAGAGDVRGTDAASVAGAAGDATALASGLRDLLASYLSGPSLRTLAIDARLTSLAIEEARGKSCGHVLVVKVTQQRRDGGGSLLGRTAAEGPRRPQQSLRQPDPQQARSLEAR